MMAPQVTTTDRTTIRKTVIRRVLRRSEVRSERVIPQACSESRDFIADRDFCFLIVREDLTVPGSANPRNKRLQSSHKRLYRPINRSGQGVGRYPRRIRELLHLGQRWLIILVRCRPFPAYFVLSRRRVGCAGASAILQPRRRCGSPFRRACPRAFLPAIDRIARRGTGR